MGPLAPGQNFGSRYHIIKLRGSGGMGAVYQAWDEELGVAVALKVIRPEITADPETARDLERRFKRELLLARQVTHKNVVRIHDLGEIDGIKYLTMPYVHGSDLGAILQHDGRLSVARALRIARQIVAGLLAAHEAGVVHRDLKPANVMIDAEDQACIMDFGIARSVGGGGGTMAGAVVGTLEYMAPEQAAGHPVDQRADIYAFGLILYDMLSGRRRSAHADSAVAELMQRMQQAPPSLHASNPAVPEAIGTIIQRCLQPDARLRYQTTAELAADLDTLDAAGATSSTVRAPLSWPAAGTRPQPSWRSVAAASPRVLAGTAALLVLIVVVAGALILPGLLSRTPEGGAAVETVSLAVLPFRNASGDKSLDWLGTGLAEMLRTDVGTSAQFRMVGGDRVERILTDLRIEPGGRLDSATIRRVADFSAAGLVLHGQYLAAGSVIRIDATLEDLKRERTFQLKAEAPNENGLLKAVDELAAAVRTQLASSPEAVRTLEASSWQPSTSSVQALRHYTEGLKSARVGSHAEALASFKAATDADPKFALAHAQLAQTYANLRHDSEAEQYSRQAVDLASALPEYERNLILATHARLSNEPAKAIEAFERLLASSEGDPAIHFELARLHEQAGTYDRARDHLVKATEADPKHLDALFALGRVEIRRRNPQGALEYLSPALTLAVQLKSDEPRANILNAMGIAYKRLDRPAEALRHYQDSLEIKRQLRQAGGGAAQDGGIAATLTELGQIHRMLGQPNDARRSFTEALDLRQKIGDKRGIGNTLIELGTLHSEHGDYAHALKLYRDSLQIQRELGNANYESLCLNNIGAIYVQQGLYDDAVTHFERALALREKLGVQSEIAETLHNLAETSSKRGQYEQALTHYLRALEIRRAENDQRLAAFPQFGMGRIFGYQGRYSAAVTSTGEAVDALRQAQERSYNFGEMLAGHGQALAQIGRAADAAKVLDEAEQIARQLQNGSLQAQVFNARGDLRYFTGDFAGARNQYDQALAAAVRVKDREQALAARANVANVAIDEGRHQAALAALKNLSREAGELGFQYQALKSSILLARGLIDTKQYAEARRELEPALRRVEQLGLRVLAAWGRCLLGDLLRLTGSQAPARAEYARAADWLEQIRREGGKDDVLVRPDLKELRARIERGG